MNNDNSNPQMFLGITLPIMFAMRLSFLDDLSDNKNLDYGPSSYWHITVVSPRGIAGPECMESVRKIAAATLPHEICLERLERYEPNNVVAIPTDTRWLKALHMELLHITKMPQIRSEWEGDAYNPHMSIAKYQKHDDLEKPARESGLPYRWTPNALSLFVLRRGIKPFSISPTFFPFRRSE